MISWLERGSMEGQLPLDAVLESARRLSVADRLRLIEALARDLGASVPEERSRAAAAPSPEEIQQMRDEVAHDF